MKRYILLLALVSMQVGVTLPTIRERFKTSIFGRLFKFKTAQTQAVENKPEPVVNKTEPVETKEEVIHKTFGKDFDYHVGDNLDEQQLENALRVKQTCSGSLLKILSIRPDYTGIFLKLEGRDCVLDFVEEQARYKYENSPKLHPQGRELLREYYPAIYNEDKQRFGQAARDEAFRKYLSEESGNLAYLFKDPLEEIALKNTIARAKSHCRWIREYSNKTFRAEAALRSDASEKPISLGRVPPQGLNEFMNNKAARCPEASEEHIRLGRVPPGWMDNQ